MVLYHITHLKQLKGQSLPDYIYYLYYYFKIWTENPVILIPSLSLESLWKLIKGPLPSGFKPEKIFLNVLALTFIHFCGSQMIKF